MMSDKVWLVLGVLALGGAIAYAWYRSQPETEIPLYSPLLATEPATGTPPVVPAEMVSDTTFDIISPSTQPANSLVSGSRLPGSEGY